FGAEQIRAVIPQEVHRDKGERAEISAQERTAEGLHLIEARRITVEPRRLTSRRAGRRLAVQVEVGILTAEGPSIGDVVPVIGAPLHLLAAVGVARAELQTVEPVAVEIIFAVTAHRIFMALATLEVVHDRADEPIVRIAEAAR